ncbi:TNF receptor-associated factor 3-like [Dysidea avara]|uniref:TNF receptor-associated factor 3-like n=1 Tax=Dysidea avara TaxID=196820 RepID=UPI00332B1B1A
MPGYRVYPQDGGDVRDGLTCSYCELMLKDAVQTTETGLRFCKGCFEKARNDPKFTTELDPDDKVWPDFAVKREIANLKVKCENYETGCDWTGLFKDLMKHLDACQFVTMECKNPGCGEQVLLSELEVHLKEKCLYRQVQCKNCGKKMFFIELQEHTELCPNAPKVCGNCKKKIPASQYLHHITHDCKVIKCVCKEEDAVFEVGSDKLKLHLEDTSKLADHLAPMITEFSKMSLAFQNMTEVYHLSVKRIEELEMKNKELEEFEIKHKALEKNAHQSNERMAILEKQYEKTVKTLHEKIEAIEKQAEFIIKQNTQLTKENEHLQEKMFSAVVPRNNDQTEGLILQVNRCDQKMQQVQQKIKMLESSWVTIREEVTSTKTLNSKTYSQIMEQLDNVQLQQQQTVAIKHKSVYGGEVVPYDKPPSSELVKQVEDKVLEVERTLNVLNVHHSELELQLQASLASTHNGTFLWRIPEVHRRMRDAKIGRITSIYSPPFYTGRNGYKMCIRAYLNGDGSGEGTHLSIFFVLMRGEYDPLLQWPFEPKVSLILVDQDHKKHLVQTFKPNAQSSSFKRPVSDMNVASGCPEFAELSILDNPSYVKEDVMYIKGIVDTSRIFHP